jgi:hypothetical protein
MLSSDVPLGYLEIPLGTVPADGSPLTNWYPLLKLPKMKAISGEVSMILLILDSYSVLFLPV